LRVDRDRHTVVIRATQNREAPATTTAQPGTPTAAYAAMSEPVVYIAPAIARRALIGLVAEIAWAERSGTGPRSLHGTREAALSLLARMDRGDREAPRRAMELVSHAHARAA
jgi:hypothetical protein